MAPHVQSFHTLHTRAVTSKDLDYASPRVGGHLIKNKFATNSTSYMASSIKENMKKSYEVNMRYMKVWRCWENALNYVRGILEESLTSYLHIL